MHEGKNFTGDTSFCPTLKQSMNTLGTGSTSRISPNYNNTNIFPIQSSRKIGGKWALNGNDKLESEETNNNMPCDMCYDSKYDSLEIERETKTQMQPIP